MCIGEKTTVISQRLAYAIKLMDSFSLSYKDVENRLREAYAAIGLTQSSGGISPSCFLCAPHPWKEIDLRYHVQNNKAASQSVI